MPADVRHDVTSPLVTAEAAAGRPRLRDQGFAGLLPREYWLAGLLPRVLLAAAWPHMSTACSAAPMTPGA
ncbi:MAG TPA: hypothetical protein VGQ26_23805 [Streptosporangiaceae bacterium]|nr:hypothetical protein [Streptosporangiaceae bacterium]